jgi:hypothetical protein
MRGSTLSSAFEFGDQKENGLARVDQRCSSSSKTVAGKTRHDASHLWATRRCKVGAGIRR